MEKKNTLLIVGVVLSVLLPPVGIIICLICLNDIKNNNKPGKNLATNGIMVGILVMIVAIIGSIFLIVHIKNEEKERNQRLRYERQLEKICDQLDRNGNYDSYDKEHPKKRFIQCHNGDCYMYKDGETLASVYCNLR